MFNDISQNVSIKQQSIVCLESKSILALLNALEEDIERNTKAGGYVNYPATMNAVRNVKILANSSETVQIPFQIYKEFIEYYSPLPCSKPPTSSSPGRC
jgi:hypothetical protein